MCCLYRHNGWAAQISRWEQVCPGLRYRFPFLRRIPNGIQGPRRRSPETIHHQLWGARQNHLRRQQGANQTRHDIHGAGS